MLKARKQASKKAIKRDSGLKENIHVRKQNACNDVSKKSNAQKVRKQPSKAATKQGTKLQACCNLVSKEAIKRSGRVHAAKKVTEQASTGKNAHN